MPDAFHRIPDHFKAPKMCDHAVIYDPSSLAFVPDWFTTKDWVCMWYDDYYDNDDGKDKFIDDDDDESEFLSGMMVIGPERHKKPQ